MGKEFDLIESGGVLHHMAEPIIGWKVLVDLLKPGGLTKIGRVGSTRCRKVREEIAALKVGTLKTDIRRFRQRLKDQKTRVITS